MPGTPMTAIRNHDSAACCVGVCPPASRIVSGRGQDLARDDDDDAESEREPRGLHAFVDGRDPVAGAVPPGRPTGRAVLDEGADDDDEREQGGPDTETGEGDRPEMADDGRVDEQVERLGGQHHEG